MLDPMPESEVAFAQNLLPEPGFIVTAPAQDASAPSPELLATADALVTRTHPVPATRRGAPGDRGRRLSRSRLGAGTVQPASLRLSVDEIATPAGDARQDPGLDWLWRDRYRGRTARPCL